MAQNQGTAAEGRAAQFKEMMERIDTLQARYKGVRGELLAKVREELMQLAPTPGLVSVPSAKATPPPPAKATPPMAAEASQLPSCRACGRSMRARGDGTLVCQNGHTRFLAG